MVRLRRERGTIMRSRRISIGGRRPLKLIVRCPVTSARAHAAVFTAPIITLMTACASNHVAAQTAGANPACSKPAQLNGHPIPSGSDLSITVTPDSDPASLAQTLSKKYSFKIRAIWTHAAHGFWITDLDTSKLPLLRCEPGILSISVSIPTSTT
jgi:hypothetical protein